jgi:hypothetical protein
MRRSSRDDVQLGGRLLPCPHLVHMDAPPAPRYTRCIQLQYTKHSHSASAPRNFDPFRSPSYPSTPTDTDCAVDNAASSWAHACEPHVESLRPPQSRPLDSTVALPSTTAFSTAAPDSSPQLCRCERLRSSDFQCRPTKRLCQRRCPAWPKSRTRCWRRDRTGQ